MIQPNSTEKSIRREQRSQDKNREYSKTLTRKSAIRKTTDST